MSSLILWSLKKNLNFSKSCGHFTEVLYFEFLIFKCPLPLQYRDLSALYCERVKEIITLF
jgi:hypothetical protein